MKKNKNSHNLSVSLNNPIIKKFLLISGLCIILIGAFIIIYNNTYSNKIFPKVIIGGIDLGGKNKEQAREILKNAQQKSSTPIELIYSDKKWIIENSDLDFELNIEKTANIAYDTGRSGGLTKIIKEQLKSIFSQNKKLAYIKYNRGKLDKKTLEISSELSFQEKDATIKIENNQVIIIPEKNGHKLDFFDTQESIITQLGNLAEREKINLILIEKKPVILAASIKELLPEIEKNLTKTILLKSEKKDFEIKQNEISDWITVSAIISNQAERKINLKESSSINKTAKSNWATKIDFDLAKILRYSNNIATEINNDPQDAKFQVENGKVTTFQVSITGYKLDISKASTEIYDGLFSEKKEIVLPVEIINPEIASDSATSMGLIEQVAEGKSNWRGSPANRIHNITLGANKISGTIVKPGEEFSTIKTIGVIDGSTGFLPELVIKNSTEVTPEYGGGLCQVSTTLFRAALNAGLKITQREPHSFRVSYYEPPVGMDATIYDPSPDLKFINTYSKPILIWAVKESNSLTFQIYGTKDGRNIEISVPTVFNYVSPPPSVYKESASLGQGVIKQIERALSGCTASFTYRVTDGAGKELEKQVFVSKYVALPNTYLYGPGTEIPSG